MTLVISLLSASGLWLNLTSPVLTTFNKRPLRRELKLKPKLEATFFASSLVLGSVLSVIKAVFIYTLLILNIHKVYTKYRRLSSLTYPQFPTFFLRSNSIYRSRKRYALSNMLHHGNPTNYSLYANAKSGMRYTSLSF